jgi:hypothetical protein
MAGEEWEVGSSFAAIPPMPARTWENARDVATVVLSEAIREGHRGAPEALRKLKSLRSGTEAKFELVMGQTLVTVYLRRLG